jgi:hypothetical protein
MAKCEIIGLPKAKMGMQVVTADSRDKSTIEAEKGETMLTTNGLDNRKQLFKIGGEKHSNGGTPLQAESGTAIYSDYLKLEDPVMLAFFNEVKPKTFAQISKKYNISKWQDERDNEDNDKITNASLDKNIDDGNFKLSALFTMQEFHHKKGAPEEHSKHFEPFMERMGLTPEDLFGMNNQQNPSEKVQQPEMARYGTEVKFDTLPKFVKAGEVITAPPYLESNAYNKEGITRLNRYLKIYGLSELALDTPPSAVKIKVREAQKAAIKANPSLIFDFMTTDTEGVGPEGTKSHRPNIKLQDIMTGINKDNKYKPSAPDGTWTNNELKQMLKDNVLNTDNILDAYEDGKWWYRMVNSDISEVSKEELAKIQASDAYKTAPEQNGYKYIHQGDGYYKAYKAKEDGTLEEVEPDAAVVDELHKWNTKPIDVDPATEQNMDFLWANKRATAQARKNRRNIPYLEPLTAVSDTFYTDQAYYNPDQAIGAIQSMTSAQGTKGAMFAPQQQQASNFLAGQQFDLMGQIIGDYADKNVNAYNNERNINTNIAQRSADKLASAIEGHHDKVTTLKQNYANAYKAADNNVAENEIAMWEERANRLNLEATIGEQYVKDPVTGVHKLVKTKDLSPTTANEMDVADRFNDLKKKMPGTDDAIVAKLALGIHSGKYEVDEDFNTPPQAAKYQQT